MDNTLQQLLDFLARLESAGVPYKLNRVRDAIMVVIPSPSEYLEVEFFPDVHIEVQTFGPQSLVKSMELNEIVDRVIKAIDGVSEH